MIVQFGDCSLDAERRELSRASAPVHVEPQVFDLLLYLIANRQRVVSKDDIIQDVWGGRIISDAALSSRINGVRQAIGDDGKAQAFIRTMPRRGFRFVGEVREEQAGASKIERDLTQSSLSLPERPSIAVLPFANLSDSSEQEYFADGMVEEIITALARIRWLLVIARNSSFTYKGRSVDVKQVGRELGVRYVMEGSVRREGLRVRITAQLIEAETGTHLWADHFDGSLDDVFDLQDKVALSVAGVIEPTLEAAEIRRSGRSRASDITAYDLYLRALSDHLSFQKDRVLRAIDLLRQVVERDPQYGPALSVAAWCHTQCDTYGWAPDREQNIRDALTLAYRSLQVADDDPSIIARAAFVIGRFGNDIDGALALIDRALQLNPGSAAVWHSSGWLRLFAGQPDLAIEHLLTSTKLSPRAQRMETLTGIGIGHLFARRFPDAAAAFRISLEQFPHFAQTYRFLAATLVHLGQIEEARDIVKRLNGLTAIIVPPHLPYRSAQHRYIYLSGLRRAAEEASDSP